MSLRLLWRPVLKLFLGLGLGLALGGMLWACAQGEGDRCEREEDCQAGLRCAKSANSISGRCTSNPSNPGIPDAAIPDAMAQPPTQTLPPDAGVDQALPLDAAPADSAPADAAVDAAPGG